MQTVDLNGTWQAILADEDRRRFFADPDTDDSPTEGWGELVVPSHWRANPAFKDTDGPLLARRRFQLDQLGPQEPDQRRWWLILDGIFYQGDVWLDGQYVGDTEGYFFPHSFDITDLLAPDPEHVLAIEIACSPQADKAAKSNLTGSLQHSTWLSPDWNPGGIWQSARLEQCGPLRIRHLRVRCLEANAEQAVLGIRAVIDSHKPTTARLASTISRSAPPTGSNPAGSAGEDANNASDHELSAVLAAGENRVEWTITVDNPDLWWPHALGDQPLYDLAIQVFDDAEVKPSHRRTVQTGLRTIELKRWIMRVNGERLFLKGTNLGPTRQNLAGASPDEVAADIASAKELGLDFVRVHSHIARPELYAAADAAGMLIWQDLPLQWGYARSVRKQALRQAREAVDLLSAHPSVAVWCGHNEPLTISGTDESDDNVRPRVAHELRRKLVGQILPSWNRSILDRSIRRTLRGVDGTRPVVAHSGVLPHLPQLDGTDSHLWFGWQYGEIDDLGRVAARWPRLVRFVTEFGAQAVPTDAGFCRPEDWPNLDWDRLVSEHGLRRDLLGLIADPQDSATFSHWMERTQVYQAELIRRQAETLRRLKYRPTGGFAQFLLADAHPAISPAILDHRRRPKLSYAALAAACRPVIAVADPLPKPGEDPHIDIAIHVVSDRREAIAGAVATAELTAGGEPVAYHRWEGDIPADSCVLVGRVHTHLSPLDPGDLTLQLTVTDSSGRLIADNFYRR